MKKLKMGKNYIEQKGELIEYINECFWYGVAISSSREGLQMRLQNPQINFHNCRENCPKIDEEGCCNQYLSLEEINFVSQIQ